MWKCFIQLLLAFSLGACTKRPNFVFILTDDQDLILTGLTPMTNTIQLLGNYGMTFENAFVSTPVCCPSRSSILTGKYLHNTGVRNNSISGNCSSHHWQENHEPHTFPAILKRNGYKTFYAGKYLNQYGKSKVGGPSHIPFGYDWWIGLIGNSKYYDYNLSINGTEYYFKDEYLTDVLKNYSLDFLNQNYITREPFFMMVSTPAPHAPFTPAARHSVKFPDAKVVRTPAFNYTPTDKHWLLQLPPTNLPTNVSILDDIQKHRMQTLLAVDELIAAIIKKLQALQILDNTYIILTSDNGFHIGLPVLEIQIQFSNTTYLGQFGLPWDKRQPYDTDIRVPLLFRGPNIPEKSLAQYPTSLIDLAPTILQLAGVEVQPDMDGLSLKDVLFNENICGERILLIEYHGEGNANTIDPECPWKRNPDLTECSLDNWCKCQDSRNNTFTCLRHLSPTINNKYCQFEDNEIDLDPINFLMQNSELNMKIRFAGISIAFHNEYNCNSILHTERGSTLLQPSVKVACEAKHRGIHRNLQPPHRSVRVKQYSHIFKLLQKYPAPGIDL